MNRNRLALCAALTLTTASAAQIADGIWTLTRLTDASGTIATGGLEAPTLKLLGTRGCQEPYPRKGLIFASIRTQAATK
ncbi:hypothetical protein [Deinococcus radiopugnans]|uniref:META domain-containing protein n=1 Tax=Deinococcus radiopugnans ATCC 19172 TaxID=585398 RepID=A0ABR6NXI7_9DEIO|nr:hypothetical protein [Deinococcus radiopugnans]MBB6018764.1 hypothetical protein [Deinococcus radiopugnans ATCC 19172]